MMYPEHVATPAMDGQGLQGALYRLEAAAEDDGGDKDGDGGEGRVATAAGADGAGDAPVVAGGAV
jgi:hypothetical protein